jgi:energy-coupling factor transport system ATP-binding protein
MTEPIIRVQGLDHVYGLGTPFEHRALSGIHLELERGCSLGVIGATGAGKSTLLQHLNGLLRPQTGAVHILDMDLGDPDVDLRLVRRRVGLAFQRPESQLFEQYVGDDVAYGPRAAGLQGDALRERVRWAMSLVGLDFVAFKDRLTWSLSGGEKRKAALAGVLALRPSILVLDEPTAGLDPASRAELLRRLLALRGHGIDLVVASHNMDDIATLADEVLVLDRGRVALQGPVGEVFSHSDRLSELGLDIPPALWLVRELADAGVRLPGEPLTLVGAADAILDWLDGAEAGP